MQASCTFYGLEFVHCYVYLREDTQDALDQFKAALIICLYILWLLGRVISCPWDAVLHAGFPNYYLDKDSVTSFHRLVRIHGFVQFAPWSLALINKGGYRQKREESWERPDNQPFQPPGIMMALPACEETRPAPLLPGHLDHHYSAGNRHDK